MKRIKVAALMTACMLAFVACGETKDDANSSDTTLVSEEVLSEGTSESSEDLPETNIEDFEFVINDDGTCRIKSYNGHDSIVVIPSEFEGHEVVSVAGFYRVDELEKVIIPDSVTTIDDDAFKSAKNLKDVQFGANVKVIGAYAFTSCNSLESITLPDTVTDIGEWAFSNTSIKEFTIPSQVTEIKESTFSLSDLQTITIPGNVKSIGESAFEGCDDLTEVIIEEGLETIGDDVFSDDDALERIVLPASLTSIDESTTLNSTLTVVVAPAGSYAETYAKNHGYEFVAK